MPEFLVSAATGALGPVLGKLAALLGDEYKRFRGVRGEVKFLIRELEAMHAFLLKKSEEENPDAQDKAWMKEVRELSYDIEDSLDDFRVRVGDDDSAKPDGFIDKCKNLLAKTKARRRIAKAIQDLKVQVREVSERNARYKQISVNTNHKTVDRRALAIFEDASRLVGIDRPKQEVISFLKKEDGGISSQQPKMVSIVGIGGIGKTTLADRVYQELKDQFDCRAFLSVSRNPNVDNILRTILSQVTGRAFYTTEAASIQQLVMEIREFLQTKRYFIVVDDVWDVETWDTIKCALSNNSFGSLIITTTRIHDVAKACCSLYSDGCWVYKPKPLQEQDSKRLFHNRIFGTGNECPEYLKEVSGKILKKCGGLPLAIIAISGLLANKARNGVHSVSEWDQVHTCIGHGLERDSTVEGMMAILSLSYFDLPSHLKSCLLYLSTFPEDFKIMKSHLVRLWVAEGFIPPEFTCTLYESGEKAFNELINRNLIFPDKINDWTGKVKSCRVHDTILDFIVCKSSEDNFVTVHGVPRLAPLSPGIIKVRRLSLQGKTEGDATLPSNQNYANVRSVICFGPPCSLLGFRFLRVLDFAGILLENHQLANIGELLQLRYLGLRYNHLITELPEQIGALQYLETLDIRGCDIRQLPTAIVRLERLVNLRMGPVRPNCVPRGIRNMQALEELKSIHIEIKAAAFFFEEIAHLTKMKHLGVLFSTSGSIDQESYVNLIKEMVSSLQRLNKLQILDLELNHLGYHNDVIFNGDDIMLEVPWCSASLRILGLNMSPMSRVPRWIKSLVNIEELELRMKKLEQEILFILCDLPVLVDLTLHIQVKNVEGIPSTDKQRLKVSNIGFRSLRRFKVECDPLLDSDPSNPMVTFEAGSMPELERLRIYFDVDLTISVSNGHLDFGLNHLSRLVEVTCFMFGNKSSISSVQAAIVKELDNHPKLPCFRTTCCPTTEDEWKNRKFTLTPRRRRAVDTTQPKPSSSIADLSEQEPVRVLPENVVICTSGGDDKMSSSTTDDITGQPLAAAAALPLPTDLSFTMNQQGASPGLGRRRHGQQRRRSRVPNHIKGTSGAATTASDILGPRLIAAPHQQQGAFVPPYFTFSSGSPPNAKAEKQAMDCHEPSQHDNIATAFSRAFYGLPLDSDHPGSSDTGIVGFCIQTCRSSTTDDNTGQPLAAALQLATDLSFTMHQQGASPDLGRRRHGQQHIKGTSGAATTTSDILGPRLIAAPHQQQGAFVPPYFTFSSGSPPNAKAEKQAMDCHEPSQHDNDIANAFSSAFNGLSFHIDHPGSSDTGSSCQGGGRQEEQ